MKKLLSLIMVLALIVSFAACGGKESEKDGAVIDFDMSDNDISFDVEEYETSDGAKIDFDMSDNDISFDVEEYETSDGAKIEFDIRNYDFDFQITTYELPENKIEFEVENFDINISDNFSEADISKIGNFTEEQKIEIIKVKYNLLQNLENAFNQAGLTVKIDEQSGEISLDASVLFGGDSAELTDAGKEFLKKFITIYSTVIFSEEFDGFISKIFVEGHTAPVSGSTYESGLPLSEERAENVKAYCLSSEAGVAEDTAAELDVILEAVGLSNTKPVTNEAGVDMDASRRVTFRFLINIDM